MSAIENVERDVGLIVQGLRAMAETQKGHTELLENILEAATVEPEASEGGGLVEQLEALANEMKAQTAAMKDVAELLRKLPEAVAAAVREC